MQEGCCVLCQNLHLNEKQLEKKIKLKQINENEIRELTIEDL